MRPIGTRFFPGILIIGLLLFGPAGTFNYWQAWLYCGVLFILISAVIIYFFKRDPALGLYHGGCSASPDFSLLQVG